MDVFDIIGPVMIGPSSSHTAGAVKLGRIARQLFGAQPTAAEITLHGSFAMTGPGHGTDLAIVAGLLGFSPDDARIRQSLKLAKDIGLSVSFKTGYIRNSHPNTTNIELSDGKKCLSVTGSSIGGGNVTITSIDGLNVEFTGQYNTLVVEHKDTPGVVAAVSSLLAADLINIASMRMYRSHLGGKAIMIIETDSETGSPLQGEIGAVDNVCQVTSISPIQEGAFHAAN
jgi:L-serine dehydratase